MHKSQTLKHNVQGLPWKKGADTNKVQFNHHALSCKICTFFSTVYHVGDTSDIGPHSLTNWHIAISYNDNIPKNTTQNFMSSLHN